MSSVLFRIPAHRRRRMNARALSGAITPLDKTVACSASRVRTRPAVWRTSLKALVVHTSAANGVTRKAKRESAVSSENGAAVTPTFLRDLHGSVQAAIHFAPSGPGRKQSADSRVLECGRIRKICFWASLN